MGMEAVLDQMYAIVIQGGMDMIVGIRKVGKTILVTIFLLVIPGFVAITEFVLIKMNANVTKVGMEIDVATTRTQSCAINIHRITQKYAVITELVLKTIYVNVKKDGQV